MGPGRGHRWRWTSGRSRSSAVRAAAGISSPTSSASRLRAACGKWQGGREREHHMHGSPCDSVTVTVRPSDRASVLEKLRRVGREAENRLTGLLPVATMWVCMASRTRKLS